MKPDRLLSGKQMRERYGVTGMTMRRWRDDPNMNFPPPDLVIKGRPYWYENGTVIPWERGTVKRRARG